MSRPRRKRNRIVHVLAHLVFTLVALAGLLIAWLAVEVRSLDFLKPTVQEAVSTAFAPYRVEAEKIFYTVDTDKWALVTGLSDVTIFDPEQHRVATFSQINLDLGLLSLLSGGIRFETLEVVRPAIRLTARSDGTVTLSVSEQEEEAPAEQTAKPTDIAGVISPLRKLAVRTVIVKDAFLGIVSPDAAAMYRLPRVMLLIKDQGDTFSLQYDAKVKESQKTSRMTGSLDMSFEKKTLDVSAVLTDFNIALLAPFHAYGAYLANADMRVSGTLQTSAGFDGALIKSVVDVEAKDGSFAHPELFIEPILFSRITAKAHMEEGDETLHIGSVQFENADMNAQVKGDVRFTSEGIGAEMEGSVRGLKIDRIKAYWPPHVSLDARDWVTSYLTVGTVEEATAKLSFMPEDLKAEETPAEILDAKLKVKNASIEYLPGYPKIIGVDGDVTITARGLEVIASRGTSLSGTVLNKGRYAIPDFEADGMPMELELDLKAPAKDVVEIIGDKRLNLVRDLKLNPETISGVALGQVALSLPLYSADWPKDKPYVTYDVKAKIEDASQKKVLDKWDIAGMSGDLTVDNDKLTLKTITSLQGVDGELDVETEFSGKKKTSYRLVADIPRETMPVFGFEIPDEIQGILGVNATVEEAAGQSITRAKVNLSNAAVMVPDLNYDKMVGVPATLTLTQEAKNNQNIVPNFTYESKGATVAGSYTQDKKTGEFVKVSVSKLVLGNNDFRLDYALQNGRKMIALKGKTLDISAPEPSDTKLTETSPAPPAAEPEKSPLEIFKHSRVDIDLKKLLLSKGHGLDNLSGYIDCHKICQSVNLQAAVGDKATPFSFIIAQGEKGRELSMTSLDAGGVIKAFDVSDHVQEGELDFKGSFDDSVSPSVMSGRLIITKFRVVRGPILAKLLSLASLTGFLDTLAGNGIAFAKLSADAKFSDVTLWVKNGKAFGSAIGITVDGVIKPFSGKLDLDGAVVPAYTANSVIGKIPLLGDILTGGKGGGVIAANYSIEGDGADPSVMVNPLSLLTPGFLRNLFDVFEEPKEAPPETNAPAAEAAPAKPEQPTAQKPAFPAVKKR